MYLWIWILILLEDPDHRSPSAAFPCSQDHGDLEKNINVVLETRGLQRPQSYVTKVIQLYDTMNVRFGVMLVGPTGGGKSECYRTLQVGLRPPTLAPRCSRACGRACALDL